MLFFRTVLEWRLKLYLSLAEQTPHLSTEGDVRAPRVVVLGGLTRGTSGGLCCSELSSQRGERPTHHAGPAVICSVAEFEQPRVPDRAGPDPPAWGSARQEPGPGFPAAGPRVVFYTRSPHDRHLRSFLFIFRHLNRGAPPGTVLTPHSEETEPLVQSPEQRRQLFICFRSGRSWRASLGSTPLVCPAHRARPVGQNPDFGQRALNTELETRGPEAVSLQR